MDKGVIQQMAAPSETYRAPSNAFVAGFIGVTNFVSGKVAAVAGGDVTFEAGAEQFIGAWTARGAAPTIGSSVTGALRAEQIRLATVPPELSACQTVKTGIVRDSIFEGERIVYEVALAKSSDTLLRVFDHDPGTHKQFNIGETVAMGWNPRDVLTFPN